MQADAQKCWSGRGGSRTTVYITGNLLRLHGPVRQIQPTYEFGAYM